MPRIRQTEVHFLRDATTGDPVALVDHVAFARRSVRYDRNELATVLTGDERVALVGLLAKLHADAEEKVRAQLRGELASLEVDP